MSAIEVELTSETKQALSFLDEERVDFICRDTFIYYSAAEKIIKDLEYCFRHPRASRMPCRLLVGDTYNGKTHILEKFVSKHPKDSNPEGEHVICPVININAPKRPDEGQLYDNILDSINAEYSPESKTAKKRKVVYELIRVIQTRMLIIDEIHNMARGNVSAQSDFRVLLKTLSNELNLSIIIAGTEDAYQVIQVDDQTTNRFVPLRLSKWDYGDEYLSLLNGFEESLPLKRTSFLAYQDNIATKILAMADGLLGEISSLLKKAAIQAIESGSERITLNLLDALEWTPPQKRKDH